MAQWDTTADDSHAGVQMCQSKAEGGRRCSDGRRFMKDSFTTADLAPSSTPNRPPIAWLSESLDQVKEKWPTNLVCAALQTVEKHSAAEARVTSNIEQATPAHARLDGLAYRMKSPASVCRKVYKKQVEAVEFGEEPPTADAITGRMKDVLRYTIVSSQHDNLADDARATAASLTGNGWKITEAENFFKSGNSYKGLHLTVTDEEGVSVEVQIHSEASFDVKEKTHPLYEESREPSTLPGRMDELRDEMVAHFGEVKDPEGIGSMSELEGCEVREIRR